jgi:hypothetical protein
LNIIRPLIRSFIEKNRIELKPYVSLSFLSFFLSFASVLSLPLSFPFSQCCSLLSVCFVLLYLFFLLLFSLVDWFERNSNGKKPLLVCVLVAACALLIWLNMLWILVSSLSSVFFIFVFLSLFRCWCLSRFLLLCVTVFLLLSSFCSALLLCSRCVVLCFTQYCLFCSVFDR